MFPHLNNGSASLEKKNEGNNNQSWKIAYLKHQLQQLQRGNHVYVYAIEGSTKIQGGDIDKRILENLKKLLSTPQTVLQSVGKKALGSERRSKASLINSKRRLATDIQDVEEQGSNVSKNAIFSEQDTLLPILHQNTMIYDYKHLKRSRKRE